MSSSQDFLCSSQLSVADEAAKKSKFTYRHLALLASGYPSCPLRVIAHIDLDAFYAQCEMVRLEVPADKPLAVQQWGGLIAINYPARAYGMNRHIVASEAQKLCPEIILQHVATWKEGDDKWAYRDDANAHMATHKVSLDPYRLESRKILACIKDHLPAPPLQRVEKASIDEVFLDLSKQVYGLLVERYPELSGLPPYDDPTEKLPCPATTALDWDTDALVDLDSSQTEDDHPDWDDIAMLLGSEIVRGVRNKIFEQLKYTCSAGVACNKMLAKLGSGHRKPNQQTVIRNRSVRQFLTAFKFTKIRNLGGKLGDQVVEMFATDSIEDLLQVPVDQLKRKLSDDTGTWLWQAIRGEDHSEVSSRTQIKSMLSAKSFRPSINTFEQAVRWLRIFVADIFSRLVEEGVLEHKRRPRTLNLHHRQGGTTRSKQLPIPGGKTIDEALLFELAKTLLGQVIVDGRAWPCANLSLSVGGFEDGPAGNRGIGSFLLKGEEARTLNSSRPSPSPMLQDTDAPADKRRKTEDGGAIQRFLAKGEHSHGESEAMSGTDDEFGRLEGEDADEDDVHENAMIPPDETEEQLFLASDDEQQDTAAGSSGHKTKQLSLDTFFCQRCSASIPIDERSEHEDWHFAQDLQAAEHPVPAPKAIAKPLSAGRPAKSQHKGKGQVEKGQQRLAFG